MSSMSQRDYFHTVEGKQRQLRELKHDLYQTEDWEQHDEIKDRMRALKAEIRAMQAPN